MEEQNRYPRWAQKSLEIALSDTPVTLIQGARQVGKSTLALLVHQQRAESRYLTLDDPNVLAAAQQDPVFFAEQNGSELLIIDEAQRCPELLLPIKASVDRDRKPGRFLLTGSADLLNVPKAGDSLAGRAETLDLSPLSMGEATKRTEPEDFVSWISQLPDAFSAFSEFQPEAIFSGGYPEVQSRNQRRRATWFHSYIDRLTKHDAREIQQGGFSSHLNQLLQILGSLGPTEIVSAKLARTLGIAANTTEAYIELARALRLVENIPAWGRTAYNRVSRRPKVMLNDTALAATLSRFTLSNALQIGGRETYGVLLEQFVALELTKQSSWSETLYSISHFRNFDGLEADLIVETDSGDLIAIEVKASQTLTIKSWRNLEGFKSKYPDRNVLGICFYTGSNAMQISDWLYALPITALWQH